MPQGVVKNFETTKGTGEIEMESGETISVHRTAIDESSGGVLHLGDIVEFKVGRNRFGNRAALEVRRIGWEEEEETGDEPREWTF